MSILSKEDVEEVAFRCGVLTGKDFGRAVMTDKNINE